MTIEERGKSLYEEYHIKRAKIIDELDVLIDEYDVKFGALGKECIKKHGQHDYGTGTVMPFRCRRCMKRLTLTGD